MEVVTQGGTTGVGETYGDGAYLEPARSLAATVPDLAHACDSHYPWQTEDVITERHTFTGGRG